MMFFPTGQVYCITRASGTQAAPEKKAGLSQSRALCESPIQPEKPLSFPFSLRIPAWCSRAALALNGQPVSAALQPGTFHTIQRLWQPGDVLRLELPFELALHHWPGNGVSLSYGPLTLALPVPARAEIESENSTTRQRMATLGSQYEPRPAVVKPEFPAWNLYPAGRWNYALCIDEASLRDLKVEWNKACPDPLDGLNPALKVRVKARRVRGWRVIHIRKTRQFGHWIVNGQFRRGIHTILGEFYFTPTLPDPNKLPAMLSSAIEEIDLVPYAATLLRVTVFPRS